MKTRTNNTMARAHEIQKNISLVCSIDKADVEFGACLKLAWKEKKGTAKRVSTKTKIITLIKGGYNTVEALSDRLNISRKNVSSNLTYLRRELAKDGMTLTSEKRNGQTIINLVSVI